MRGLTLFLPLLAVGLMPGDAPAQQANAEESGWRVQCDGVGAALDCRVSQTLVLKQTSQVLLSVIVRRPANEPPALMLQLPHGLFLPAGAGLQLDAAKPRILQIQTCDHRGCYAGEPLPKDALAAWQKAGNLTVSFQDLQKQPITVKLSLQGFREAYAKLP